MQKSRPFVLSIAGIDPSAGAGLLTDIKTLSNHQVSGLGISTCITIQNHQEITDIHWFDFSIIQKQIDSLCQVYEIDVVKIGVVPNWILLYEIVDYLKFKNSDIKIIVDPVLVSTSGFTFCEVPTNKIKNRLLDSIYLITPNQFEYDALFLDSEGITCNILLKSPAKEKSGTDILINADGSEMIFSAQELGSVKHGSGCALSSAIAANLAKGESLEVSIDLSKRYIENYLRSSETLIAYQS